MGRRAESFCVFASPAQQIPITSAVMFRVFALSHRVESSSPLCLDWYKVVFIIFFILKLFLVMNRNSSACCGSRSESSLGSHLYCEVTSLETFQCIGILQGSMEMNSGCVGAGMWGLIAVCMTPRCILVSGLLL